MTRHHSTIVAIVAGLAVLVSACGGSTPGPTLTDPTAIITHRLSLADAPGAYKMFRDKQDGCVKVVLKP